MKLATVAEMRRLEEAAIAAGSSEAAMMEEAGLAVAQEAWMLLGTLEGRSIAVLAGPGKNGGDALIAARHLADWGASVTAFLATPREDDLVKEVKSRGAAVVEELEALQPVLAGAELVVDGLLGTGRHRPIAPSDALGRALSMLAEARRGSGAPKLLAVDIPSGIDADTGAVDLLTVAPDVTVTFGLPKVGMYQAPASALLGKVQVIDIGLPKAAQEELGLELLTARWARGVLPARPEDANKGTFGKLLIVGGCSRYPGAPRLAALGAYRSGAGLVTIACPEPIVAAGSSALAEATWLPLPAADGGELLGEATLSLRQEWRRFEAAIIGPGLSDTGETRALTWAALPDAGSDLPRGLVVDADALNAIAQMPDAADRIPSNAILTPHPGEMARLMGSTVEQVQSDRLAAARGAAQRFNCIVVLKGAHTVVAGPGAEARLSPFANPLLASAGTGDVLAGIIGGLLAQGLRTFEAASVGVYLHGAAAEAARAEFGDAGMLASELAARLPSVIRELKAL